MQISNKGSPVLIINCEIISFELKELTMVFCRKVSGIKRGTEGLGNVRKEGLSFLVRALTSLESKSVLVMLNDRDLFG